MVETQVHTGSHESGEAPAMQETGRGACAGSRRWKELSPQRRAGIGVMGAIQLALLIAAEVDIQRRPADEINGSKIAWRLACLINFVGPLSYFRWGRRRGTA